MEKVLVTVEMTNNNYAAYIDALPGCVSTGKTFDQLKKNMEESVEMHLEISREYGDEISSVFDTDFELVYKFDAASLLQHYSGIFTNAALERITGINQRQLQRYASGGEGKTVADAKSDFENLIKEEFASYTETGKQIPIELQGVEFEYKLEQLNLHSV